MIILHPSDCLIEIREFHLAQADHLTIIIEKNICLLGCCTHGNRVEILWFYVPRRICFAWADRARGEHEEICVHKIYKGFCIPLNTMSTSIQVYHHAIQQVSPVVFVVWSLRKLLLVILTIKMLIKIVDFVIPTLPSFGAVVVLDAAEALIYPRRMIKCDWGVLICIYIGTCSWTCIRLSHTLTCIRLSHTVTCS